MAHRQLNGNVIKLRITDSEDGDFKGFIVFARDDDGLLRHIEIHAAKVGSMMHGVLGSLEVAINQTLQGDGEALEELLAELEGQVYSPKGTTNDPEIPEVTSLANYLAIKIRLSYYPRRSPQPEPINPGGIIHG